MNSLVNYDGNPLYDEPDPDVELAKRLECKRAHPAWRLEGERIHPASRSLVTSERDWLVDDGEEDDVQMPGFYPGEPE